MVGISVKCDARAVAGGESQLSVVIADQVLPDFSEDGMNRSSRCEINFVMESRRTLRFGYRRILVESAGKFVVSGSYSVVNEQPNLFGSTYGRNQTVTGRCGERIFHTPSFVSSQLSQK